MARRCKIMPMYKPPNMTRGPSFSIRVPECLKRPYNTNNSSTLTASILKILTIREYHSPSFTASRSAQQSPLAAPTVSKSSLHTFLPIWRNGTISMRCSTSFPPNSKKSGFTNIAICRSTWKGMRFCCTEIQLVKDFGRCIGAISHGLILARDPERMALRHLREECPKEIEGCQGRGRGAEKERGNGRR